MNDYNAFIRAKTEFRHTHGFDPGDLDYPLFPHQSALTRWALRKGRALIAADTGLGKTRMELVWADQVHKRTEKPILMLAPPAVTPQTVREGMAIGIDVRHVRDRSHVGRGIHITNYERLHRFDCSRFAGIVLDESSIIKHSDSRTLQALLEAFRTTPYKLCATATPAPNDHMEFGTHAEFLGICTRGEMLSKYFVHDGGETQKWRLKGHARHEFWRWVSSWCAMVRSPADLGFDASMYDLPPLRTHQINVQSDASIPSGELLPTIAQTLTERRKARRDSLEHRVRACGALANRKRTPWVIWCELNAEADALRTAIPDAVEIRGTDPIEHKEQSLMDFADGKIRVLITKPKIAGFGLNWQHCHDVAFVGVSDSWESYYQAVRRCWRFGQTRPVHVYLFVSEQEGAVRENLERKELESKKMFDVLSAETRDAVRDEVLGQSHKRDEYNPRKQFILPDFIRQEVEDAA